MYTKRLYVSGGSFYELQEVFDHVPGVTATRAGYLNAEGEPSYDAVKNGWVRARMGVEVTYNPKKTDLSQLVDILFAVVDPCEKNGQGKAKGAMYQSGVYYTDDEDEPILAYHMNFIRGRGRPPAATESRLIVNDPNDDKNLTRCCVAEMMPLTSFHPAEAAHQHRLAYRPGQQTAIDFARLYALGVLQVQRVVSPDVEASV